MLTGVSVMTLASTESWEPLPHFPQFRVPPLRGVLQLQPSGAFDIQISHDAAFSVELLRDWVALREIRVDTAIDVESFTDLIAAQIDVPMVGLGTIAPSIAGDFNVNLTAALRPDVGAADFTLSHAGGWSPLEEPYASIFRTPAFACGAQVRAHAPPPRQ